MPVAVKLTDSLIRIPHISDLLNSYMVLDDDGSVTLIDGGLARGAAKVRAALAEVGRGPSDVQRVILTHAHSDHAGGAAQIVRETGVPGVEAHPADHPYLVAGTAPPVNAGRTAGRILNRLQSGSFEPVPIARGLNNGEILPVAGGLRVLHTPGHTPGHVSLLHADSGWLLTGDCILHPFRRMIWPFAVYCVSPAQNDASAELLADVEFESAAFTHGTEIKDNAREAIRNFITRRGLRRTS